MRFFDSLALTLLLIFSSGFVMQSCAADPGTQSDSETSPESDNEAQAASPQLNRTVIMRNLKNPWDLAIASDGSIFFTEKCRGLSVRKPNGNVVRLFGTSGSALVANDLVCEGQSGMQGVALDPDFASNRQIFVFMSSRLSNPKTNRVIRLTVGPDGNSVSGRQDIVTDIAYKNSGNNWGGAGAHSGGRLRFGPDGFLYITSGDNHNGTLPQDLNRLGGKVLRVNRSGLAAPGNNAPSGGDARIYTYGHRNVQGISFHPRTGRAFIAEHGPGHSDEVTALVAGGNGGWDPKPDPGVSCADNYCGYTSNKADGTPTSMTDLAKFPNAMKPFWKLDDSAGMGPCLFLNGSQWKDWNGALLVGIMRDQKLMVVEVRGDAQLGRVRQADLPSVRYRSLVQGSDGNLYISTDGGEIWKVSPQ